MQKIDLDKMVRGMFLLILSHTYTCIHNIDTLTSSYNIDEAPEHILISTAETLYIYKKKQINDIIPEINKHTVAMYFTKQLLSVFFHKLFLFIILKGYVGQNKTKQTNKTK